MQHKIICLVGSSASGKTAISEELMKIDTRFKKVKTATTRQPRPNESEDAYFFISKEQFEEDKKNGVFLETSVYAGEMYGTPKFAVDEIIRNGNVAVVPIDINGAMTYKEVYGNDAVTVFVYRDKRTIIEAIVKRNIPIEEKSKRIEQLDKEYQNITYCDRCVINNGCIEDAVNVVKSFELV